MKKIKIYEMNHPKNVSYFIDKIASCNNEEEIVVSFEGNHVLPAACVPICGIIKTLQENGKNIKCSYPAGSYLSNIRFNNPYKVSEHTDSLAFPFSKIWRFNDFTEVTELVNAYSDEMQASIECASGLVEGLEWSLNEVMDNVLQHSESGEGFMMGVIHKSTKCLMFSVYDNGQGIFNSFRDSEYHPRNPIDAISLSIQEGKTRDRRIGQGNGLWGLYRIIQNNKGRLEITSHGSSLVLYSDGKLLKFQELPILDTKKATTTINMSIYYDNNFSVVEALGGYQPADIRFENKVDDDNCLHFIVSEESTGYGTRVAGERVRLKVINYFKRIDPPSRIIIDFSGLTIISSSFADEFIGKLVHEWGFCRFTNMVFLSGVSPTIQQIINRSVCQRMAVLYSEKG